MSALPILLLGLHFCWYGVLVFATGRILVRWIPLRPEALLGAGVVGASFLGYAAFWIFLLSVPAGVAFDVVILLACALSIRRHAAQARQLDVVIPGLLVLFIALFYVGVLGAHADSDDLSGMTNTRFVQRTYDDALPQVVAERIYNGLDPRILDYGWRSSDRPPLQTGVVLLQRPFVTAGIWTRDSYEIVGLLFQLAWIPALWYLGRTIGVGMQQLFLSIVLVAMTGFVFMNSTYVWPKCSAAALEIFAISVAISKLLGGGHRQLSLPEATSIAMALGLALLSHGSAAFAFPAIVALCCLPGVRPRLPVAALASVAFIIVLTPWAEYQTFFDPPGDRLLKLHLAGVNSLSDRRTTLQAVIDQYEALGFQGAVDNKRANLLTLAPPGMPGIADILPVSNAEAASSALTQHFYVAASLGLLNAGWFCLPFLLFRTDVATREVRSGVLVLLALVVATLLFWVLAMFGPGTAYTVLGSYTPELVLDFILACSIVRVRPVIAGLVYALVAMSFVDTYVVQTAGLPSQGFSAFATIVAAVGLVALVAMWRRIRILAAQAVRRQGATTTSILRGETI